MLSTLRQAFFSMLCVVGSSAYAAYLAATIRAFLLGVEELGCCWLGNFAARTSTEYDTIGFSHDDS